VIDRPSDPSVVGRLRSLCLALDDVEERLSHGEPTWFVRGRSFAILGGLIHVDVRRRDRPPV